MADRYWVGGSGTWDATTTHWSTSSGGGAGASAPGTGDNAIFDSASAAADYTVTLSGTLNCLALTVSAPAAGNATFAGTATLNVFASYNLYSGCVWSHTGTIEFESTSTGRAINTAGTTLSCAVTFNGNGGGWTLNSNLTLASAKDVTHSFGTIDLDTFTITAQRWISSNSNTRVLTFGSGTIALTAAGNLTIWNTATTTGLTVNAGSGTLSLTTTSATVQARVFPCIFAPGGISVFNLSLLGNASYAHLFLSGNVTVGGALTITGANANSQRVYIASSAQGTARTITCNGSIALTNCDLEDITLGGSAAPGSGTSVGDCGGNSGVTFTGAVTRYWVGNGGNFTDTAHWSTASGGGTGASMPLPQDTAIFDAASFSSGSQTTTINVTLQRTGTIDLRLVDSTPTFACGSNAPFCYGSFYFDDSISNLTASSAITLAGRGTYDLQATLYGAATQFTVECVTGVYRLAGDIGPASPSANAPTLVLTSGEFDFNDYNAMLRNFASTNSNTRTLRMGTGTIYCCDAGAVVPWDTTTTTGLTFLCETSTLEFKCGSGANAQIFRGGGLTYNRVNLNHQGTGKHQIEDSNTFAILAYTGTAARTIEFEAGTTQTITGNGGWQITGTLGNVVTIASITAANHNLVYSGTGNCVSDYLTLSRSQATPATTWYAGANSTDSGNNTGWIFTAEVPDSAMKDPIGCGIIPWAR